jgi:site-specific recombinase XerD
MFPTGQGQMFTLDGFRAVFQRASVRAGINHGLSPNHLRHTAAAFAIHHGATVYDVQRMLGHAKPSITLDTYGYLWDSGQSRLAETLDAAIREAQTRPWDGAKVAAIH